MFFSKQQPWHEEPPRLRRLFVYGTLSFPEVLSAAVGRTIEKSAYQPATLHGFRRHAVKDARFPVIRKTDGCWVQGYFLGPFSGEELEKLDDWEGTLYERTEVSITTESGEVLQAWVFADLHHKAPILDHDWTPRGFSEPAQLVH